MLCQTKNDIKIPCLVFEKNFINEKSYFLPKCGQVLTNNVVVLLLNCVPIGQIEILII